MNNPASTPRNLKPQVKQPRPHLQPRSNLTTRISAKTAGQTTAPHNHNNLAVHKHGRGGTYSPPSRSVGIDR